MRFTWVLVALILALSVPSLQAPPSSSAQQYGTLRYSGRHLTWWPFGSKDEEPIDETTTSAPTTIPTTTFSPGPTTTEKPSGFRAWFSKAGNKIKTGASKVGNTVKTGASKVGTKIKDLASKAKTKLGEAKDAIKRGGKKVGNAIKSGFRKIRVKFTGEEKFNMTTKFKEQLEARDVRATELMKKLGVNVLYVNNTLSSFEIFNVSVTEGSGGFPDESYRDFYPVEEPVIIGEGVEDLEAREVGDVSPEEEVFHSAEDYDTSFLDDISTTTTSTSTTTTTPKPTTTTSTLPPTTPVTSPTTPSTTPDTLQGPRNTTLPRRIDVEYNYYEASPCPDFCQEVFSDPDVVRRLFALHATGEISHDEFLSILHFHSQDVEYYQDEEYDYY